MRASAVVYAVAAVGAAAQNTASTGPITGALGNATVVVDNPPGEAYLAVLPETAFDKTAYPQGGNAKGRVWVKAQSDGIGLLFKAEFSNLPKTGGPFIYHIHNKPVPEDGNCTATEAHLDPFERGEVPPCDSRLPQTCQVGDLSGKHGKITSDPFHAIYRDLFVSTNPASPSFMGNLSFVLHFANKTRITCANFELQGHDAGAPSPGNATTTAPQTSGTSATASTTASASASATVQPYATVSSAVGEAGSMAGMVIALVFAMTVAVLLQ